MTHYADIACDTFLFYSIKNRELIEITHGLTPDCQDMIISQKFAQSLKNKEPLKTPVAHITSGYLPFSAKRSFQQMGLLCQWYLDRKCFGKELITYLYVPTYIHTFMKSSFPKHDLRMWVASSTLIVELVLIAFWQNCFSYESG